MEFAYKMQTCRGWWCRNGEEFEETTLSAKKAAKRRTAEEKPEQIRLDACLIEEHVYAQIIFLWRSQATVGCKPVRAG